MKTERITALDVKNGNTLYNQGFRVIASNVRQFEMRGSLTARYTLTSAPNAEWPETLPGGYEGMLSGGNHLAFTAREIEA